MPQITPLPCQRPSRPRGRDGGLLFVLSFGLLVLLAGVATAPPSAAQDRGVPVPTLDPDFHRTSHKVVLITDQAINPRLVTLDEGQLVAWISYSKATSQIVFEREIARNIHDTAQVAAC